MERLSGNTKANILRSHVTIQTPKPFMAEKSANS